MVIGPLKNAKKEKVAFQKGIIVSIKSVLALWAELKEEGCKFLLTRKLNQDCLENFFSAVRSLGGQDTNPNPVQFCIRIHILKMQHNIEEVINLVKDKDTPVEVAIDEGFEELFVSSEIGMKGDIFRLFFGCLWWSDLSILGTLFGSTHSQELILTSKFFWLRLERRRTPLTSDQVKISLMKER